MNIAAFVLDKAFANFILKSWASKPRNSSRHGSPPLTQHRDARGAAIGSAVPRQSPNPIHIHTK
jgi:hypothetical protein